MRNNLHRSEQGLAVLAQELPEGTVTVIFAEVTGSTDLTTRGGDEAAEEVERTAYHIGGSVKYGRIKNP
jgi:class 3 adenylate cyclase